MRIRCKVRLDEIIERRGWAPKYEEQPGGDRKHTGFQERILFDATFRVVHSTGDDSENKKFWEATPSGEFKLATIQRMPWIIGDEYYVDVIPAARDQGEGP